jgi:hypothetical protein
MTTCAVIAATACSDLGYHGAPIAGTSYTDEHVAQVTTEAVVRQRKNFPLVCGSSPKEAKRRNRRFHEAVKSDVGKILGLTFLGIVIFIFGGPAALALAIISAVFSWMIEKELEDHWQGMYAAAAMELA